MDKKVIGYFVDVDGDKTIANDVFVAIEYIDNYKVEVYCPIGQHHEAYIDYVKQCEEITKEEYIMASERFYTPKEYV